MAKHISDRDIERVVGLLDGWKGKLTWELLCEACRPVINTAPARQTLCRFARVKDAFNTAKFRLNNEQPSINKSLTLRAAVERINRLTAINERQNMENRHLLQQFVVWQYNAHIRGMSDDELNRALPPIDRGNTS